MNENFDFLDMLQARLALLAIGRSTLRSQGAVGMVDVARKYLRKLDLKTFSSLSGPHFDAMLEKRTTELKLLFPAEGRGNWGAARKALNIFLRDVVYCRPLAEHFDLMSLEAFLELPLDRHCYDGLCFDYCGTNPLPNWPGVMRLTQEVSGALQQEAMTIAHRFEVARVHLDVRYWRVDKVDDLAR